MNYANTESRSPIASRKWRIRHSAWLLAPMLGMGIFSFVGFLYTALRVRNRKFWIAFLISCLGSVAAFISPSIWNQRNGYSGLGGAIILAVWSGLFVFAIILNRDYLRWRANRTESNAWYNQPVNQGMQAPAAPARQVQPHQPAPSGPGTAFLGVNNSRYYAPPTGEPPVPAGPPQGPSGTNSNPSYTPPVMPPAQQTVSGQESARRAPLNVNTASGFDLATLLGVDPALADRVVSIRLQQGPYRDLDHLVSAAGLQPHELLRFRNKVRFSDAQQGAPNDPSAPSGGHPFGVRPLDY